MIGMHIILEGDGAFDDWVGKREHHLGNNAPAIRVAALEKGMVSGHPSLMIGIELPDGSVVKAETSLRLFLTAADAFKARFGDPRVGEFGGGKAMPFRGT